MVRLGEINVNQLEMVPLRTDVRQIARTVRASHYHEYISDDSTRGSLQMLYQVIVDRYQMQSRSLWQVLSW